MALCEKKIYFQSQLTCNFCCNPKFFQMLIVLDVVAQDTLYSQVSDNGHFIHIFFYLFPCV